MKRISTFLVALLIVLLPIQVSALSLEAAINSAFDATNGRLRLKIEAYDSTANNDSFSMGQIVADNLYDSTTKAITVSLTGELAFTGDQTMTGDLTVTGDTDLTGAFDVTGDTDLTGDLTVTGDMDLTGDTSLDGALTVNDSAAAAADFQVKGDTETHALFVDASTNSVGIRNNSPASNYPLDVTGAIRGTSMYGTNSISTGGKIYVNIDSFDADDVTPDVSGGNFFLTVENSGATAITDLDSPQAGQIVIIICGHTTNAPTIADSGNFALTAAWAPDSVGDSITLFVAADNTYYELARADN